MIEKLPKYNVICDCCGDNTFMPTKSYVLKHWLVYQNVTNGDIAHFCCDQCARKYIHIKKLGFNFVRITKVKYFTSGGCVDMITGQEEREFKKEIKK